MKDFYDIWAIARQFKFEGPALTRAIHATFERRGTSVPDGVPSGLSGEFSESPEQQARWRAFVSRGRLGEHPRSLPEVAGSVSDFLLPVASAIVRAQALDAIWDPGGPWRPYRISKD
jgi:hypothetical protein